MADEALLEELTLAVKSKNCKEVQRCVSALNSDFPIPLHTCKIIGVGLLELAVDVCCADAVQMLLEKGAVADTKIGNEFLIHRAVAGGDMNIVKQLIRSGAKFDSLDYNGQTPLFTAVSHDNEEMVQFLLKSGASLDVRTNDRETILETAIMWNAKVKIFEVLFNYGVDINVPFSDNTTLLVTIVCMFLENNVDEKKAETLLRLVLENGALITQEDGETGLHVAARYGLSTPVKILLEYGVNVNIKGKFPNPPLTFALDEFYKITYLFLRRNDDNNLTSDDVTPYKDTALMLVNEVIKLQEAKKEVSEDNVREARDERIGFYYDYCVQELQMMKKGKILNGISYFDLLVAEEHRLSSYVRNSKIMQILKKGNYKRRFPLYAEALEGRIEMGKARNKLLMSSAGLLKDILNFKLPDLVVSEIFTYMKSTDLIVLPKVLIRHSR